MTAFRWASGPQYESYVGRWSRRIAQEFVRGLELPAGARVLDVGCGTGALSATVLALAEPREVVGVDPSDGFVAYAREQVADPRASFAVAGAEELPFADGSFDAVVSGLVLNFVPDPARAVAEMARVAAPGGLVTAYVWDYADGMQLMRYFWDAAGELDPAARELDEGRRFPVCRLDALAALFREAGLDEVETSAVEVETPFRDFDDYWTPFLSGDAPAPGYAMSLGEDGRERLRELLRERLPTEQNGSIRLTARAWAVRGRS